MLSPKFTWIPLGVGGGLLEKDLSAHLIAPMGSHDFICLDAGTLLSGLKAANEAGCFHDIPIPEGSALSPEGYVLHHHIKAYLISHPYLDHTQGLAAISPNDAPKPVLSMEGTIAISDLTCSTGEPGPILEIPGSRRAWDSIDI